MNRRGFIRGAISVMAFAAVIKGRPNPMWDNLLLASEPGSSEPDHMWVMDELIPVEIVETDLGDLLFTVSPMTEIYGQE